MIVCVTCNRVMVPLNDTSTAWIKQTKKEHPLHRRSLPALRHHRRRHQPRPALPTNALPQMPKNRTEKP